MNQRWNTTADRPTRAPLALASFWAMEASASVPPASRIARLAHEAAKRAPVLTFHCGLSLPAAASLSPCSPAASISMDLSAAASPAALNPNQREWPKPNTRSKAVEAAVCTSNTARCSRQRVRVALKTASASSGWPSQSSTHIWACSAASSGVLPSGRWQVMGGGGGGGGGGDEREDTRRGEVVGVDSWVGLWGGRGGAGSEI